MKTIWRMPTTVSPSLLVALHLMVAVVVSTVSGVPEVASVLELIAWPLGRSVARYA